MTREISRAHNAHIATASTSNAPVTPEEWARLHALESAIGGDSLVEFVARVTPRWIEPWHLIAIARLIAAAEYGPVRAVVSVPPRHGKTELLLHAIAWWLSRHPQAEIVYAAAEGDLAKAKSRRAKDIAINARLPLRQDAHAAREWMLPSGGGLKSVGVGGSIVGRGADLLIVDDPFRSREDADSPAYRERVWNWFQGTIVHRVEPGGSCIVVHTRWHQDDLVGRIGRELGDEWQVVNLPAVGRMIDGELVATDDGDALWPDRWPIPELASRRLEVGEFNWWALFQGRPSPKGGGMFRRSWWRFYKTGMGTRRPDGCTDEMAIDLPSHFDSSLISVDAAFKKTIRGSRVAGMAIGFRNSDRFILDNRTGPLDFLGTCNLIRDMKRAYPMAQRILVEDKANGPAIIQTLHSELAGIIPINPRGGKESRASAFQPSVESGNWYLPEGADWLDDFVSEFAAFPTGTFDDQVDAVSQAAIYMTANEDVINAMNMAKW